MIDSEEHRIGSRLVQRGIRQQRILQELIVCTGDALQGKAMTRGRCNQNRNDEVERPVADETQPKRNERGKRKTGKLGGFDGAAQPGQLALVKRAMKLIFLPRLPESLIRPLQREAKSAGGLGSHASSRYSSTDTADLPVFCSSFNAAPTFENPDDNI